MKKLLLIILLTLGFLANSCISLDESKLDLLTEELTSLNKNIEEIKDLDDKIGELTKELKNLNKITTKRLPDVKNSIKDLTKVLEGLLVEFKKLGGS
jgi:Tfp pilus assembly protein PilN